MLYADDVSLLSLMYFLSISVVHCCCQRVKVNKHIGGTVWQSLRKDDERLVKKGPFNHLAAAVVQQQYLFRGKNLRILFLPFIL